MCFNVFLYSKPAKMIYIEQIYKLYESNLYRNQTTVKRNIFWLENSLKLPNIHPIQAIIVTDTWEEYVKYKLLLRFHIHYLLTKEYTDWGWIYDKQDVTFYNMEWADQIEESFEIAKSRYLIAQEYWKKTKELSRMAYDIGVRVGWEKIESLNYEIQTDTFDYDYDDILEMRLADIERKLDKIKKFKERRRD